MLLYRDDENVAKVKELEHAAVNLAAGDISEVCARLGQVKLSARALGLACRYREVDCVRALVEGGATFDTPKKREEKMLYHAYSPTKYDFHHSNYSIYLLNIDKKLEGSYCAKSMRFPTSVKVGKMRLTMLPDSERAKVLKYLCETKEKCSFKPSELLFYSIFARDDFITDELKKLGIKLSEDRIKALTEGGKEVDCYWREYRAMTDALAFEDFIAITERLSGELNGGKIRCTDNLFNELRGALNDPKFADFFFDKFNTNVLNRSKLLREMIDNGSTDLFPIVEKAGWLSDIKRRDSLIEYATENGKTECTAWLLDFKNRTADLAAEREKAERKLEHELNASPDSVTALKALWSYVKLEDGTLIIKRYKGDQTEITVPGKIGKSIVTVIGESAFSPLYPRINTERRDFLRTVKKVMLSDTITKIEEKAFLGCIGLEDIDIPDSVAQIGDEAFYGCLKISRVKLPKGLSEIPRDLFALCKSLQKIAVPYSVKSIGSGAFSYCNDLTEAVIPDSVTEIKYEAFSNCKFLEKVKLPNGLTELASGLFFCCEKMKAVTIPDSVKRIGSSAFYGCNELCEIVIPDGVTAIERQAFVKCNKLKTVVLPASIKFIAGERYGEYSVFIDSPNVTVIVEKDSYAENYCRLHNRSYKYKE